MNIKLNNFINVFDKILRKYTPDPFIIAIILTGILFSLAIYITPYNTKDIIRYWGDGFWNLIPFTLQMVMVLVGGYVVAISPPIKKILHAISRNANSPGQAIILVTLSSMIGSFLNWGLGLIIGAIMCRQLIKQVPKSNFRLLVASAYSGFIIWHGGLSGSIPLTLATPGNFSQTLAGGIIPIQDTLLSTFNISTLITLFVVIPMTNWLLSFYKNIDPIIINKVKTKEKTVTSSIKKKFSPAEKIEKSPIISWFITGLGLSYLLIKIIYKEFSLNLNTINFIFLFSAIFLHKTPESFIKAISEASTKVAPILIQFPFYSGIMGIMSSSNLGELLSKTFIEISTLNTFPLFAFYSAGLLNLFIPSGGGQWAIQAPVVLNAAKEIGANIPLTSMAVAWGDAWTNMLQPFWALPLLSIAGLHLRHIISYCFITLIISGTVITALLILNSIY